MEFDLVITNGTIIDGTGRPRFRAEVGIRDGRIAEGQRADLVLFDPETVADNTTAERADAPPSGIRVVLIGGQVVVRDGQLVQNGRHGVVLRR